MGRDAKAAKPPPSHFSAKSLTHISSNKATQKPFFASRWGIGAGVKFEFRASPYPGGASPLSDEMRFMYFLDAPCSSSLPPIRGSDWSGAEQTGAPLEQ